MPGRETHAGDAVKTASSCAHAFPSERLPVFPKDGVALKFSILLTYAQATFAVCREMRDTPYIPARHPAVTR